MSNKTKQIIALVILIEIVFVVMIAIASWMLNDYDDVFMIFGSMNLGILFAGLIYVGIRIIEKILP